MALVKCVDCGKQLSPTAVHCNGCNSTDPFGIKRDQERLKMQLSIVGLGVVGVVWLAFHFDLLTIDMIKNFLKR